MTVPGFGDLVSIAIAKPLAASIGASRLPAGARNTAQHLTNASVTHGPHVRSRPRLGFTIFKISASGNLALA